LHREHAQLAAAAIRGDLSCSAGFHVRSAQECTGFEFAAVLVTEISLCRSSDAAFAGASVEPATVPPGEPGWHPPAPTYLRRYERGADGRTYAMSAPAGRITAVG
jgi:hypothetical protein